MYFQITTRCNMTCDHCLFACRPGRGKDMSQDTFRKAYEIASDYDSAIVIGGGEPTLHPDLLWFLGYASLLSSEMTPLMVTNGSCDEKTWNVLIATHLKKNLDLRVSKDPWHDEDLVGEWVWDDADRHKLWWGENNTRAIIRRGRGSRNINKLKQDAYNWGYAAVETYSHDCLDPRVDPNGIVWADTNKCNRVGPLSGESIGKAYEILNEYEEAL